MPVADVLLFADHPLEDEPQLRESEPPLTKMVEGHACKC